MLLALLINCFILLFRELAWVFPHLRKIQRRRGREGREKGRDKRTKVNGVFREFSIPFIVSVRPFVAATSHGKKAGADPRTVGRLPANFSKARATAVAIIPNEKVTAVPPLSLLLRNSRASRSMLSFIFYAGLET